MQSPSIELDGLRRRAGDREVLSGVDLAVRPGETVALVGANGTGKSTLIRTVLDLRAAHGGRITLGGRANTDRLARARVAYLPERFQAPLHLRGREFLAYMLSLYGVEDGERAAREAAAALGLGAAVLDEAVSTYSKGTAQLLGLAACLASERPVLVLDEPMDGLDPAARVRLRNALAVRRDAGASILFSSHLLADAAELADRIAILHDGRIVADGTAGELCERFGASSLEAAYMRCTGGESALA